MKYRFFTVFLSFILLGVASVYSQQQGKQTHFDIEKFKKDKAEFIKNEAGLTDTEAKAFLPLMNELMDKKFELNRSRRIKARELRDKKEKIDSDYDLLIEKGFDVRAKEIQLDKEYYLKFKKILSSEKIYKCQRAESKFVRRVVNHDNTKNQSTKK